MSVLGEMHVKNGSVVCVAMILVYKPCYKLFTYRIACIFRRYKYSQFLLIKHAPLTFIPTNLISHACMLHGISHCYVVAMNFP